ncbi:MAG: hypothetical protein F4Y49_04600 [Dehalococcoidia bacterium]|nr:hypothetical protein [Dehalococcoidia bacterium]
MQLIVDGEIVSEDPNAQLVTQEVIENLTNGVEIPVILVDTDVLDNGLTYVQAVIDEDDVYILEYQDGSLDRHYFCTSEISVDDIVHTFVLYLDANPEWKTGLCWEKLDPDEMIIQSSY